MLVMFLQILIKSILHHCSDLESPSKVRYCFKTLIEGPYLK